MWRTCGGSIVLRQETGARAEMRRPIPIRAGRGLKLRPGPTQHTTPAQTTGMEKGRNAPTLLTMMGSPMLRTPQRRQRPAPTTSALRLLGSLRI